MTVGLKINTHGLGKSVHSGTDGALKRASDSSKLKKRFKAGDLRLKLAEVKARLAAGETDLEIASVMDVTVTSYNDLKRELFRQETAELYNRTTEDVYLEYSWKQNRCVDDLDVMIDGFRKSKQYNAIVGAVRAKSDIIERVIKMGQDMGVLDKAPEKKMILHGHVIADMGNADLRKVIAEELQGLASVVSKFGDNDLMGNPIAPGAEAPPAIPAVAMPDPPAFTDNGRPNIAKGGPDKAKAGRKRHQVARVKSVAAPPR